MNAQEKKELAFAQQYFRAGRADLAKALLTKLNSRHRQEPQILEYLGYIAGNEGDLQNAAEYLLLSYASQPDNPSVAYFLAYCLQQTNRHAEAIHYFQESFKHQPHFAEGLQNWAVSLRATGELDESLSLFRQALALAPSSPGLLFDFAHALVERGLLDDALQHLDKLLSIERNPSVYLLRARAMQGRGRSAEAKADIETALSLDPKDSLAWTNFATLLFDSSDFEGAVRASERALALSEHNPLAWLNYASALMKLRRYPDALTASEKAIHIDKDNGLAWLNKAMAHGAMLQRPEAIDAYQRAKQLGVNSSQIDYALAAYGAAEVPSASPKDYVTTLFDNYAQSFDQHLVEHLEYKVPQVIEQMLIRQCTDSTKGTVLDLGCGTGLFGPTLKNYSTSLVGVDLSPKMIEVARQRGCYDELHACDVLELLVKLNAPVRMAVALDVFVYIGDLTQIFAQVARTLVPQGDFAFSVEASESTVTYELLDSLRYAHASPYIHKLAADHGFQVIEAQSMVSRKDRGQPVAGIAFLLRRTATEI